MRFLRRQCEPASGDIDLLEGLALVVRLLVGVVVHRSSGLLPREGMRTSSISLHRGN